MASNDVIRGLFTTLEPPRSGEMFIETATYQDWRSFRSGNVSTLDNALLKEPEQDHSHLRCL